MRKKKTFEYTSYFAAEFNGFLQYRISGGSNGLEERRVLKSLDDYLIQSGMVKKKLDGTILAGLQTLFRQGDLILLELVGNPP